MPALGSNPGGLLGVVEMLVAAPAVALGLSGVSRIAVLGILLEEEVADVGIVHEILLG
jgi:hypothetical protein